MTTNKPPIAAWAPSTALHKLENRHNNAPCILTDSQAELNDVALIRLIDHERLQAEAERLQAAYEEELFCVRQNRDTHFGEMMRAIERVDALQADHESTRAADKARIAELEELIDAQRWLLKQCRESLEERNHHYVELNCYLNGSMPASDLVSLSQQTKETSQ